jgi:hypothetical protein
MANKRAKCGLSVVKMLRTVDEAMEGDMVSPSESAEALERVKGAAESCELETDVAEITSSLSGTEITSGDLEVVRSNFIGALVDEGLPDM